MGMDHRCSQLFYNLVFLLALVFALAGGSDLAQSARADIPGADAITWIRKMDPLARQSIDVVRVHDGKPLYSYQEHETLAPASVTKVVTTAAALAAFSPAHTFKTRLYTTGSRKGSHIQGDLVIVGDGDPLIISEKLWQLASDLHHLGIRNISGDLVIDNSLFDGDKHGVTRQSGKRASSNAYDAPVSAFGVNFNTVALAVAPGMQSTPLASLDPYPIDSIKIVNQMKVAGTGYPKVVRRTGNGHDVLQVQGSIGPRVDLRKFYRSISNPTQTAGETVRAFLRHRGIKVTGKVVEGVLTAKAELLYVLEGYPLRQIVQGLNTFSNNYLADVITKRLAVARAERQRKEAIGSGSLAGGVDAITEFLQDKVKVPGSVKLYDGSGLNPENRLSARQLTRLLVYMESRMDLFPEFLASFPASGWDGTLAKRFRFVDDLHGVIRAKTGTLTQPVSVSGLAGYFRDPTHGLVAFAILQNGKRGGMQPSVAQLRDSQDSMLASWLEGSKG